MKTSDRPSMASPSVGPSMQDEECDLFRRYVETHCAVSLGREKKYLFESRLARLLVQSGARDFAEFYRMVIERPDPRLRDRIVEAITTHETLWFRDSHPFLALRDELIPELARRASRERRSLRIWSAGCSTGQEPYSLAMLVHELSLPADSEPWGGFDTEILATDISHYALTIARAGRYDRIAMQRGLVGPWERYQKCYFAEQGTVSVLAERIRRRVVFQRLNLQDDFAHLGRFDLILMRNVGIYFSGDFKQNLWARLASSLRSGGWLLLGAAEGLVDPQQGLVCEKIGESHFYRLEKGPR